MQDIHSIGTGGGGGSRLFGGGVDRRLRSLNHQQALKCPRCESLNTKFCYYNNYNLSQPRHFCKACRRYWTRGGVLRNVPVGGGCRKAKRSAKPKPSSSSVAVPPSHTSNSHSSSESSSLTATTTTAAGEVISNSSPRLFNFPSESHEFLNTNPMALIDQPMFPEMMTTSSTDLGFSTYRSENDGDMMNGGGYLNQTAEINEYSEAEKRLNNCGVEEWPDQGIFDLTQPYWTQTQWPDHSFHYLP